MRIVANSVAHRLRVILTGRRYVTPAQRLAILPEEPWRRVSRDFKHLGWKSIYLPGWRGERNVRGWLCPDATESDRRELVRVDWVERGEEIRRQPEIVNARLLEAARLRGWRKRHGDAPHPKNGERITAVVKREIERRVAGRRFMTPRGMNDICCTDDRRSYISEVMHCLGWSRLKLPPTEPRKSHASGWLCPGFAPEDIAALRRADYAERGIEIDAEAERRKLRRAFTVQVCQKNTRLRRIAARATIKPEKAPALSEKRAAAERIERITQSVGDRRFITRRVLLEAVPDSRDRAYFRDKWEEVAGWRDAMITGYEPRTGGGSAFVMLAPDATEADLEAAFLQDIAERGTGNWLWYLPRLCRAWAKNSCADRFHGTEFRTP